MKHLILISLALTFSACSPNHEHQSETLSETKIHSGIMVSNAVVRPPLPGRDIATAYFTIMNAGPADQIVDVSTPISARTELHTHLNEDGVMKMRRVTAVDIPADGKLEFKPGSYHVMIFDASIPKDADDVSLTFEFVNAEPLTLIAEIEGRDMSKTTDHQGHH